MSEAAPKFCVLINDEEQYCLWLADKPPPDGWRLAGVSGSKEHCLSHIEVTWTDMRPRTLREQMAEGPEGDRPLWATAFPQ